MTVMNVVRNAPNDHRLFACTGVPVYRYDEKIGKNRWFSENGRWIEIPKSWLTEEVTFANSPREIRGLVPRRKQ